MSDSEGSPQGSPEEQPGSPEEQPESPEEQPGSPEEQPGSPEEQEDLTTETNGDHPEESKKDDQESGSRKRSLSTSEDKDDDNSPSKKVAKEEIPLAIICDSHAKALEKVTEKQTNEFRVKVKVTEDLFLATIPTAVEELLTEDPEIKCVVILLPQVDLRQTSIPHSCNMFNCSGKGLEHVLPLPVTSLDTYMDTLNRTKEELQDTYPDTEFFWATPGPVDFRHVNRKVIEKNHTHSATSEFMWKTICANYVKRLTVIGEEISDMNINWFTRACWLNRLKGTYGTQHDMHQRLLVGDLGSVRAAGIMEEGENLSVKGGQALWKIISTNVNRFRQAQAKKKQKETETEDEAEGKTEDDQQNGEKVNGKADEATQKDDDLKKKGTTRATLIGDSWIKIVSEIEKWHPDHRNRINIKMYPDLSLETVIEKVDDVLSEETDTKNKKIFLSVFQSYISSGLSAEYLENEVFPCAFSTVEDLMEKASNINKYIKKAYPQIEVFWIAPGPVGYFDKDDVKEEEESSEKEKKEEKKDDKEKKEDEEKIEDEEKMEEDEEKAEDEAKSEDGEKENDEEENKDTAKEKPETKTEAKVEEEEEEEKEEDPEIRKLRRACSSCNTIAMILNKRLHSRFKKQVVDWFEVFNSSNRYNDIKYNPKLEGQILEGKVVKRGYLDEDYINLSELGGNRLLNLIKSTIRPEIESEDHRSPGSNKGRGSSSSSGGMRGRRDDRRGGRGNSRGRGSGGWNDGGRPTDRRPNYDNRGSGQYNNPWGQQGGGSWKGQQNRYQGQGGRDMRDVINRDQRTGNNRRGGNWGGSGGGHYVDPWARNNYSGYYGQRY